VRKKVMPVIFVDETRCTGCGLCTDVCPTGAISVANGVAQVSQSLCQECETCLSTCPTGAILSMTEPATAEKPMPVRLPTPPLVPTPRPVLVQPTASASRSSAGVWPYVGNALDFVGREVIPRLTALWRSWGQQPPAEATSYTATRIPDRSNYGGRGGGRRARHRRGRRW